uniref:Uncharacterized protein n=1 Tax=Ciona savignyi TaxID=51511 RepID=H2YU49_CIOSA
MLGGIYLVLGLVIPVSIALIMILVVFGYVCRGVLVGVPAGRFQRLGSLKRIKTHLYKLTVLTTLTAAVIVGIVVLPTVRS